MAAPPAQALGVESVAVFGLASVLSAATAALGFKLSSNDQGQATLQRWYRTSKRLFGRLGLCWLGQS